MVYLVCSAVLVILYFALSLNVSRMRGKPLRQIQHVATRPALHDLIREIERRHTFGIGE